MATLGITAAASAIDAGIQKKIHVSGTTTLIISNEEMNDIIKVVQALEDSEILLKWVIKTILSNFIRHFRSKFVRRHVSRKRNCKS